MLLKSVFLRANPIIKLLSRDIYFVTKVLYLLHREMILLFYFVYVFLSLCY